MAEKDSLEDLTEINSILNELEENTGEQKQPSEQERISKTTPPIPSSSNSQEKKGVFSKIFKKKMPGQPQEDFSKLDLPPFDEKETAIPLSEEKSDAQESSGSDDLKIPEVDDLKIPSPEEFGMTPSKIEEAPQAAQVKDEKKGLFGRLFSKKAKSETPILEADKTLLSPLQQKEEIPSPKEFTNEDKAEEAEKPEEEVQENQNQMLEESQSIIDDVQEKEEVQKEQKKEKEFFKKEKKQAETPKIQAREEKKQKIPRKEEEEKKWKGWNFLKKEKSDFSEKYGKAADKVKVLDRFEKDLRKREASLLREKEMHKRETDNFSNVKRVHDHDVRERIQYVRALERELRARVFDAEKKLKDIKALQADLEYKHRFVEERKKDVEKKENEIKDREISVDTKEAKLAKDIEEINKKISVIEKKEEILGLKDEELKKIAKTTFEQEKLIVEEKKKNDTIIREKMEKLREIEGEFKKSAKEAESKIESIKSMQVELEYKDKFLAEKQKTLETLEKELKNKEIIFRDANARKVVIDAKEKEISQKDELLKKKEDELLKLQEILQAKENDLKVVNKALELSVEKYAKEKKEVEDEEFHDYLQRKLLEISGQKDSRKMLAETQEYPPKDIYSGEERVKSVISECRNAIKNRNFEKAKKLYNQIRLEYYKAPISQESKEMLHNEIRSLYDDINMGLLSSATRY